MKLSRFFPLIFLNMSPKGNWSLTWVQWALLLKVRFFSKSESMTTIFVKSVRIATILIFQFRIQRCICIRFVAVAFRSEEEVLWRKGPRIDLFNAPPVLYASGIYVTSLVPCLVNAVDFLLYKLHVFHAAVSSYFSSLHTFELHIQLHQLCTNNKHNTYHYKVCVFRADRKNKMGALACDWLRHFRRLLWNRWTDSTKLDGNQDLKVPLQVFVFRVDRKTRWPHRHLIVWDIFDFSFETSKQNSTKPDRKQDLNVLYLFCDFQVHK